MKVLKADRTAGNAFVTKTFAGPPYPDPWYIQFDYWIPTATFTALSAVAFTADFVQVGSAPADGVFITGYDTGGGAHNLSSGNRNYWTDATGGNPVSGGFTPDAWHTVKFSHVAGTITWNIDGTDRFSYAASFSNSQFYLGGRGGANHAGELYYFDNVKVGTTSGGSDLFCSDFEGGDLSDWSSSTGAVSVVDDPLGTGGPSGGCTASTTGRVLIAWDDPPLEPNPTWTPIDQGGSTFPYDFVTGFDIQTGRRSLISQTETGTATVYVMDRHGLFDDRNGSSPYQGKLSGRQIMLQLYNPVMAAWEPQFRGLIDDYEYTMDGSAVGADGNPVNATVQIDCVDMFDYLNGYGLTPGVDGTTPPAGSEDSVYFAASGVSDTVEDRILEILGNANIDPTMSITASGNVQVIATQYNADESALTALRDAADAELPFIGNIYCNRFGQFCFRGRYSRFAPDQTRLARPGTSTVGKSATARRSRPTPRAHRSACSPIRAIGAN